MGDEAILPVAIHKQKILISFEEKELKEKENQIILPKTSWLYAFLGKETDKMEYLWSHDGDDDDITMHANNWNYQLIALISFRRIQNIKHYESCTNYKYVNIDIFINMA